MYNPFSLIGKTILVTGASSGIGRATAVECSKMGATLILIGRNEERLKETLSLLEGNRHSYLCYDLSKEENLKELCSKIPTIDGLAHCAGISMLKPILALNTNNLQDVFSTNLYAPILLTKQLAKAKKLQIGASLVFVGSISGISNVENAVSREEGKNNTGIAIPFNNPNSSNAFSLDVLNFVSDSGIKIFSKVRSKFCMKS